jgi:hypothetical protein
MTAKYDIGEAAATDPVSFYGVQTKADSNWSELLLDIGG